MKQLNRNTYCLIVFVLVTLSCNKEVSVTEPAVKPSQGFIYLETIPTGADIYLNSIKTGQTTPDSIKWLGEGDNKILLRLNGYRDSSITVNIGETEKQFITVDFTKNPSMRGSIEITSYPTGASIIFDDSVLNKVTPYTINNLLPGEYKINLTKYNHREDSVLALVESSKKTEVMKSLVDTSVWVVYNSKYSSIPTDFIICITVDEVNNDKWIGTDQKGVVVYNEKEWKVFNTGNSSLPDNRINCIYIDNENVKWIGTTIGGVARYDDNNWQVFNRSNSELPSDYVTSIKESPDNEIWVTTYGGGIARFDGTNWIKYNSGNTSFPDDNINDIEFDERKNIFLATVSKGVIKFDGKSSDRLTICDTCRMYNVQTSCLLMKDGILYAGFNGDGGGNWWGVKRLLNGKWDEPDKIFSTQVLSISFDNYKNLYVCSMDNGFGVIRISYQYKDFFNNSNSPLGTNWIYDIATDKNNIKWIATYGKGIVKYKLKY